MLLHIQLEIWFDGGWNEGPRKKTTLSLTVDSYWTATMAPSLDGIQLRVWQEGQEMP